MKKFTFKLEQKDHDARYGTITTPHGKIETPVFMPVGTLANVKTVSPEEVRQTNTQIVLANTYHLYLRPGIKVILDAGGIHRFMNWDGPILTDSGGFQVFSLQKESDHKTLVNIRNDGVSFKSHLDGSKHSFTPERVIEMQRAIGADIIMCFDECAAGTSTKKYAAEASARTHEWAEKCLKTHNRHNRLSEQGYYQALFGIIQGVVYPDLRVESAKRISKMDFDGIAIGGLSVGESKEDMYGILKTIEPYLPVNKPRYLMGVGDPADILKAVESGIDMFDCVLPTRIARNGTVWTRNGKLNLNNAKYRSEFVPIESDCRCYTCNNFSRAYIAHLIREGEILGLRLTTIHNLQFINKLMSDIRTNIKKGTFKEFKESFLSSFLK